MSPKTGIFAIAAAFAMASCAAQGDFANRKALVFMLDGFRADALDNADAPAMRSLIDGTWQEGYSGAWTMSAATIPDAPTVSAPNHVAIACGITAAKSGVTGNGANRCDHAKWPSWLVRLVETQPERKCLFAFEWPWDKAISPHPSVEFICAIDAENASEVAKRLAGADCPDATLFYINGPDHAGHTTGGWYPFSAEYLGAVHVADSMIGDCLAAIASRPSFKDEDWIVVVSSDHGGCGGGHAAVASHGSTIPLIFAGRRVAAGRMPGRPGNCDIAPTVLEHFGVDAAGMGLDGKSVCKEAVAEAPRPLKDGLAAYMPFDDGEKGGVVGGCLNVNTGKKSVPFLRLEGTEKLEFENGADFAMAMWVKTGAPQKGDPLLAGNKNWRTGANPGLAITAGKAIGRIKTPGTCLNCGVQGAAKRVDAGVFSQASGKWTFYAATRSKDGVLTFYQGTPEGRLHFVSEDGRDIVLATGMPFHLGQDGMGAYKYPFSGSFDEFALWTRPLSHADVKKIFEAGRNGIELRELVGEERYSRAGKSR